ncbi:hypothetical protein [Helicobacter bizzozeronii]|uniref:hypothetical protein n=1 Tax=Helicobacter bizzozeronii TaxID=56877 RepID=UPI000CEDD36C|nr:hypothetical protein [Helicobacter bizzozeronii]
MNNVFKRLGSEWGGGGGVDHYSKSYPPAHHNPAQESSYKAASEYDRLQRELASTNKYSENLQNQLKSVLEWAASLCPHLGLTPPNPQLAPAEQIRSLLEQKTNPEQQEDLSELEKELCHFAQNLLKLNLEDIIDMGKDKKDKLTLKELRKMVVEMQKAVKTLQGRVENLENELEGPEGLREKYTKLEKEKGAVDKELGEKREALGKKEKELGEKNATIEDLQKNKIPGLQSELGTERQKVENLDKKLEGLEQEKAKLETNAQQKEEELEGRITNLETQMATLKGFEPYQELLKLAQEHPNLGLVANTPGDLLNEIYKAPKNLMKKVAENTLKSIKEKTADAPIWMDYFERLFAILQDLLGLQRLAIKEGDGYNPAKCEILGKGNKQGKVCKVIFQGYQIGGSTVAYSLVETQ